MGARAFSEFRQGQCEVDPLIQHEDELRLGLTLLARIPGAVSARIGAFLEEMRTCLPGQYFYPARDFHLTVISVVSCRAGFEYKPELAAYRREIAACLEGVRPLQVEFRGITASPACVMVQGFSLNDSLAEIRARLREHFSKSGLPHSMDSRYAIQTAHVTVMRFQQNPGSLVDFTRFLEMHRDREFGVAKIDELEFVLNDWYQRAENTKKAGLFPL